MIPEIRRFVKRIHARGPVAQLVERYIRIVEVGGSNPPRSTSKNYLLLVFL